jgi:hypothetical protein
MQRANRCVDFLASVSSGRSFFGRTTASRCSSTIQENAKERLRHSDLPRIAPRTMPYSGFSTVGRTRFFLLLLGDGVVSASDTSPSVEVDSPTVPVSLSGEVICVEGAESNDGSIWTASSE